MKIQLTPFELELLDRAIPAQVLSDPKGVQIALRNFMADDKEHIMAARGVNESDFRLLQAQTVKNIFQFLKENDFIGEREGGVNFLTEKGKHLKKMGSVAGYEKWRTETRAKNKEVIKTIETRGYLDQDEVIRNRRSIIIQRIKKFIVYPLLIIILLVFLVVAAHHNNLDKNIPVIRDLFKDQKTITTDSTDKEQQSTHKAKKHKKRSE